MATARLFDAGTLAGFIEFSTDDSPESLRDFVATRTGYWVTDFPGANGAILLTDEWEIQYFCGQLDADDFDPYPDFLITESAVEFA
jgi:hypothetical protein